MISRFPLNHSAVGHSKPLYNTLSFPNSLSFLLVNDCGDHTFLGFASHAQFASFQRFCVAVCVVEFGREEVLGVGGWSEGQDGGVEEGWEGVTALKHCNGCCFWGVTSFLKAAL